MPIPNTVFGPAMMLNEVHYQCLVAGFAYGHIRDGAPGWRGERSAPASIVSMLGHAMMLLSSAGILSALLYPGKDSRRNREVARRCERLRDFIGIGELAELQKVGVRNGFMHIDNRLDTILPALPDQRAFSPWMIGRDGSTAESLVLRRLDPYTLTVWFDGESLKLVDLDLEIRELDRKSQDAYDRLRTGGETVLTLWDPPASPS